MGPIYSPAEDSYLLQRHVERLVEGTVLDMGTGSGIQAVAAAKKPEVSCVVAADIDPVAVEAARRRAEDARVSQKMGFVVSDLFANVQGRFDWMIFNPPYLPSEADIEDETWDGGETGRETTVRFLEGAKEHLAPGGSILLIYSSEAVIDVGPLGYKVEILEEKRLFFETIYCTRLTLS